MKILCLPCNNKKNYSFVAAMHMVHKEGDLKAVRQLYV